MPHSLQPDHAPPMRRLLKPLGAALAAVFAFPVLGALIRPFCVALQPELPCIEPVAMSHALGALLLALVLWLMGVSPLAGLRRAAASPRERTALDRSGRLWFLMFGLIPVLMTAIGFSKAMALGLPLSPRPLFWLATALMVGLAEEYAVRGPLFELLAGIGPRAAIYGTAGFFGLLHLGNLWGTHDVLAVANQVFGALVTGLCWSFMRWRLRTIWVAAAIHGFGDWVALLLADGLAPVVRLDPSPHALQIRIALGLAIPLFAAGMVWLLRKPVTARTAAVAVAG